MYNAFTGEQTPANENSVREHALKYFDYKNSKSMENVLAVSDTITAKETMTSVEIAEVTGKRHDSVLRDIDNLLIRSFTPQLCGVKLYY